MLDSLIQDLRIAARGLARSRGFATVTIVTFALGIGANMAMFTLVNGALFRRPDVREPESIVWITEIDGRGNHRAVLGYPSYRAYTNVTSFAGVAAYDNAPLALGGDPPERIRGALVSANYFELFGFELVAGRSFRSEEDSVPLAHPVAIISQSLWERRFGSNARIIDSTIRLNGHQVTVIGVAGRGVGEFEIDSEPTDVWLPMAMVPIARPLTPNILDERNAGWIRVLARLAPGTTRERAEAEAAFAARDARDAEDSLDVRRARLAPLAGVMDPANRRQAAPILGLVSVVPLLVLMVAGFNVVNLQLSRGAARRKEFAVRRAVGASRWRLVRMLLTESALVALIACAASVWVSYAFIWVISGLGDFPPFIRQLLEIDRNVIVASASLSFVAGLLVGLVPALVASGDALTPALKNEATAIRIGTSRHRLRDAFVIAQVSVSLVLLVTAGLFLRSLGTALSVDLGFEPDGAVAASFDLAGQGYTREERPALQQQMLDDVSQLPGVEAAAIASGIPFGGSAFITQLRDAAAPADGGGHQAFLISTSPRYFAAIGTDLLAGRDFTVGDGVGTPPVVIVDQALASRLWPDADALGRALVISGYEGAREVVGVAQTAYQDDIASEPIGTAYFPDAQFPAQGAQTLVVRAPSAPMAVIAGMRRAAAAAAPDLPLSNVGTLDRLVHRAVSTHRAASAALGVFGALALVLAAIGMAGVTAHGVSLRTREIGIRMALGATATDVLRLFIGAGIGRALVGVGLGLAVSAGASRLLAGFLFGLSPVDATTFLGAAMVLCTIAGLASFIPARRAVRVEPTVALRTER